jgi:hypothetical protein
MCDEQDEEKKNLVIFHFFVFYEEISQLTNYHIEEGSSLPGCIKLFCPVI